MLLGAFLGGLIGAGTTPPRVRGGAGAVVEFLTYARTQTALMDEALRSPAVALTRSTQQTSRWLRIETRSTAGWSKYSKPRLAVNSAERAGGSLEQPNASERKRSAAPPPTRSRLDLRRLRSVPPDGARLGAGLTGQEDSLTAFAGRMVHLGSRLSMSPGLLNPNLHPEANSGGSGRYPSERG